MNEIVNTSATLQRKDYWVFRGRCRNCAVTSDFTVRKKEANQGLTHTEFVRVTIEFKVPHFLASCETCKAYALFDFVAMSGSEA